MDIVLSSQMLVDPPAGGEVLILPASTRYENPGGVTETSTERRVILSPEIPGPRIGEARAEWQVFGDLAARVRPELAERVRFADTPSIRREIAEVIPLYRGIEELREGGDSFQYGGAASTRAAGTSTPPTARRTSPPSPCPTRCPPTASSRSRPGAASSSTRWSRSAATRSTERRASPC